MTTMRVGLFSACTSIVCSDSFAAAFRSVRSTGNEARTRFFHASRFYSPAKRSAYRAARGRLFAIGRTHIACDVCTTGKWYPRTTALVPSREHRATVAARETRAEVETPRRIGEGASLACRRPSLPPETRLAACGFALPLFARLFPFLRERCLFLLSLPLADIARRRSSCHRVATLLTCFAARHGGSAFSLQVHIYGVSSK